MTAKIKKTCLVCGNDEGNVIPLFTDREPAAQPAAYIHPDCLADWHDTVLEDDESSDVDDALMRAFDDDKAKP